MKVAVYPTLIFRYVERSSVQKKLPIELWLTHPRLRVEKFPPGSLDVVNFIRDKNEDSLPTGNRFQIGPIGLGPKLWVPGPFNYWENF